jgi:hypothetical protein
MTKAFGGSKWHATMETGQTPIQTASIEPFNNHVEHYD